MTAPLGTPEPARGSIADPAATPPPEPTEPPRPSVLDQMGGPAGMLDSGLPVVVFVLVNSFVDLTWGIVSALVAGAAIAVWRVARRKPVTQAIGGLFGVGIAAFIAYRTGSAKGYFLWGIWTQAAFALAFLISILVRWPLVGVIWESLNGRGTAWRKDRHLMTRYTWATVVWVAIFGGRFALQNWAYGEDAVGWLAFMKIALGYPVFIVGLLVTAIILVAGHGEGSLKDRVRSFARGTH